MTTTTRELQARIRNFDYGTADPYEVAVLIDSVYKDPLGYQDIGPLILVQGIIERYVAAARNDAEPNLHRKITEHIKSLKTLVSQIDERLKRMDVETSGRP